MEFLKWYSLGLIVSKIFAALFSDEKPLIRFLISIVYLPIFIYIWLTIFK